MDKMVAGELEPSVTQARVDEACSRPTDGLPLVYSGAE